MPFLGFGTKDRHGQKKSSSSSGKKHQSKHQSKPQGQGRPPQHQCSSTGPPSRPDPPFASRPPAAASPPPPYPSLPVNPVYNPPPTYQQFHQQQQHYLRATGQQRVHPPVTSSQPYLPFRPSTILPPVSYHNTYAPVPPQPNFVYPSLAQSRPAYHSATNLPLAPRPATASPRPPQASQQSQLLLAPPPSLPPQLTGGSNQSPQYYAQTKPSGGALSAVYNPVKKASASMTNLQQSLMQKVESTSEIIGNADTWYEMVSGRLDDMISGMDEERYHGDGGEDAPTMLAAALSSDSSLDSFDDDEDYLPDVATEATALPQLRPQLIPRNSYLSRAIFNAFLPSVVRVAHRFGCAGVFEFEASFYEDVEPVRIAGEHEGDESDQIEDEKPPPRISDKRSAELARTNTDLSTATTLDEHDEVAAFTDLLETVYDYEATPANAPFLFYDFSTSALELHSAPVSPRLAPSSAFLCPSPSPSALRSRSPSAWRSRSPSAWRSRSPSALRSPSPAPSALSALRSPSPSPSALSSLSTLTPPVQHISRTHSSPMLPSLHPANLPAPTDRTRSTTPKNIYAKVWRYQNSRLPPYMPPFQVYSASWPLLSMAAKYSEKVYADPRARAEKKLYVNVGTKPMFLKSVTKDDQKVVVLAIRGTKRFKDWAVNFRDRGVGAAGFLDDAGNKCHGGFLDVAKSMIKPIAEHLKQLLAENPSRSRCSLLLTGHSAGGAVAALLYAHMTSKRVSSDLHHLTSHFKRVHCVTFGTPPTTLLPLTKPDSHRYKKSLFVTFVNEGDPVSRADRSMLGSLLDMYRQTAPKAGTVVTWNVPPGEMSLPGSIVVLRARPGSDGPVLGVGNVEAVHVKDQEIRKLVYGDPLAHQMVLYEKRVKELATRVATAENY